MTVKPITRIASLPKGQSGFTDPWALVEGQTPYSPPPLNPEPGAPNPPAPDPHSGSFYLWQGANVYAERIEDANATAPDGTPVVATMPVTRDENGGLVVSFGPGDALSHPPRLENAGNITSGGFVQCRVENLASALAPRPPVSAASEKARLEAEKTTTKKAAAT